MSYDISLYQPSFLKRAIAENLGDSTDADPIPEESLSRIRRWLLGQGYIVEQEQMRCMESVHPKESWGLQVAVFTTEVAFVIPYWDNADRAIEVARRDARALAQIEGLGCYDQQTGEMYPS